MEGFDDLSVPDPYDADPGAPDAWEAPLPDLVGPMPDVFDPASDVPVAGNPASDMAFWHEQRQPDTCAVAAQEFVLDALTGMDHDESALAAEAAANGWYVPGGGTPLAHMDSLLEAHGITTETHFGGTVDDLAAALAAGDKVLVSLDSSEAWEPGRDPYMDELTDPMPGQGADHAVEVIGIADTPEGRMVVLNDSGSPGGCGEMIPLEEFEDAWADSDRFWVKAGPGANDAIDVMPVGVGALMGTSTSYGTTDDGETVSYSFTDNSYYKDSNWESVDGSDVKP
jgi:hypothetical protein